MFMIDKDKYYLSHLYLCIVPCASFRAWDSTVKVVDSQRWKLTRTINVTTIIN